MFLSITPITKDLTNIYMFRFNIFKVMETIIGYIAAFCTTAAFVPQAIKVYKTKHTKDISMAMFVLMTTGIFLWLVYGLIISSLPIIIANAITIILDIYILIMKIKFDLVK